MSDKRLGQVAYEAYEPPMGWEQLTGVAQARWCKVAEAVASHVSKNIAIGIKTAEKVNRKRSK